MRCSQTTFVVFTTMFRETICCLCLRAFSLPTKYHCKVQGFNHSITYSSLLTKLGRRKAITCISSSIQNTQLTEKSVGITIQIFPDYPIEKSQYPVNKKVSGCYPIHQNFLSGALGTRSDNMDLDLWDCFGRRITQSYNQRSTVVLDESTT